MARDCGSDMGRSRLLTADKIFSQYLIGLLSSANGQSFYDSPAHLRYSFASIPMVIRALLRCAFTISEMSSGL